MPPPIDLKLLYQLSSTVLNGQEFNVTLRASDSPRTFEERRWFGRVWADLTGYSPFASNTCQPLGLLGPPTVSFEHSIERALQVVFTRFAMREYEEGLFLIKAEMGQDWFTPILQQPHCILRHLDASLVSSLLDSSTVTSHEVIIDDPQQPTQRILSDLESTLSQRKRGNTISTSHPTHFETYVIFYLGHNVKDFCSAFYPVGLIPGINSWWHYSIDLVWLNSKKIYRSAVMTVDPVMESEESSFEMDDQTFTLPQGKAITLQDIQQTTCPVLSVIDENDPFPEGLDVVTGKDLSTLSIPYF